MILSSSRLIMIFSNPAIVNAIPETHDLFEMCKQYQGECASCKKKKASELMDKTAQTMFAILAAKPPAVLDKLKAYLKSNSIYYYLSMPGKKPEMKKL